MKNLVRLVRASRPLKILPLLVLMTDAALVRSAPVAWERLALGAAFVFAISLLGMKINVLTDRELDSSRKPELHRWATSVPSLLRASLAIEGAVCAALLAVAGIRHGVAFVSALAGYGVAFVLYSYNFLSWRHASETRFKVTWWGNFTAVVAGYFCLWALGLQATGGRPLGAAWLLVGLGASLVDYGVFLNECSSDEADERALGLRTLPALLGARRTAAIAVAIGIVGGLLCVASALGPSLDWSSRGRLALLWLLVVQSAACLTALLAGRWLAARTWLVRLVDASFWIARLGMLVVLVG